MAFLLFASFASLAEDDTLLAGLGPVAPPQTTPVPMVEQTNTLAQAPASTYWNWHVQNTIIAQADPGFPARYSGPNSLHSGGETKETVSFDVYTGLRLWPGAEMHTDGLMWQGYGLSHTEGIEGFPNGEAVKYGGSLPAGALARLFIRQTFGFGGEQEFVPDDELTLPGKEDISRLTLTFGRFSAKDIFDNNSYANDPRRQFMNWALMANAAWDYPMDTVGYTTGVTAELNQPKWTLRYGFFQLPQEQNGFTAEDSILKWPGEGSTGDGRFLQSWGMVTEFERRYGLNAHPGTIRLLAFLNEADMGSFRDALLTPGDDITQTRTYRYKFGFGMNWEQEITSNVGIFSRVGWNDGHTEAWVFSDANWSGSLGLSVNGAAWRRPDDTFGLAGVVSGISRENQQYLEAGGTGILDGDGALSYSPEKILETYYNFKIWKQMFGAVDYQFVTNPAFNRARGPVSILGARLHWEL